jgi:dTDP-4-amino-4,6-dideoxygalactose transaminase
MTENLLKYDSLMLPSQPKGFFHIFQSYCILTKNSLLRDKLLDYLNKNDIESKEGNISLHAQSYFMKKYGYKKGDIKNSYYAYNNSMVIPLHSCMSDEDILFIVGKIKEVLKKYA